ncbi:hypothetical protein ACFX2C_022507 [Malus domestica]
MTIVTECILSEGTFSPILPRLGFSYPTTLAFPPNNVGLVPNITSITQGFLSLGTVFPPLRGTLFSLAILAFSPKNLRPVLKLDRTSITKSIPSNPPPLRGVQSPAMLAFSPNHHGLVPTPTSITQGFRSKGTSLPPRGLSSPTMVTLSPNRLRHHWCFRFSHVILAGVIRLVRRKLLPFPRNSCEAEVNAEECLDRRESVFVRQPF